jgi:hypothetical protein
MTPDESIARATWGLVAVTGGLIAVTFLLVLDGARKSKEQRTRWREEDKRRAEEAKPNAVVEIATDKDPSSQMIFACFNLGNNTFFIDRMIVTASDGGRSESDLTPQIVTPGTWVTILYNPREVLNWEGEKNPFKEAHAVFVLKGAAGTVTTEPVWFCVPCVSAGEPCAWTLGRLADRMPGSIPKQPKALPVIPK